MTTGGPILGVAVPVARGYSADSSVGWASVLTSARSLESGCERAQIFERAAEQVLAQVEETCPQR
jgi:hypothetical protein